MAKVIMSALIDGLKGSLQGSTFRTMKRGVHIFTRGKPANPRSSAQSAHRTRMSSVNAAWQALTAQEKALWSQFATQSRGEPTGYHAFMELNLNLLSSEQALLQMINNPPLSPNTPSAIMGFFAQEQGNTTTALCWWSPNLEGVFVKIYVGIISGSKIRWRLLATVLSTAMFTCHNYSYPTGTVLGYKARCILSDGRQGPYSFTPESPVPFNLLLFTDGARGQVRGIYTDPMSFAFSRYNTTSHVWPFKLTYGIAIDATHIYFVDNGNNRLIKADRFTFEIVGTYENSGRPAGEQMDFPQYLCIDDTYVYVVATNGAIFKIDKATLGFVASFTTTIGVEPWFLIARGISCDDDNLYFTVASPEQGIWKITKNLVFVDKVDGDIPDYGLMNSPYNCRVIGDTLAVCDTMNDQIGFFLLSDLSPILVVTQFDGDPLTLNNPVDIDFDSDYLYVSDFGNNRIIKVSLADLSYVSEFGSYGAGQDQFYSSYGLARWRE